VTGLRTGPLGATATVGFLGDLEQFGDAFIRKGGEIRDCPLFAGLLAYHVDEVFLVLQAVVIQEFAIEH
jgi:hypothetical protein